MQDATNLQAFNAYSYVQNNPLSLTDPSGFFSLGSIFKAIGHFFRNIGRLFAHAAKAIARSSIGRAIIQIAVCATGVVVLCAATAGALTLAAGGTLKQALIAAAISFAQMGALGFVHGVIAGIANPVASGIVKIGLHAVVGGAVSMAQGGSFGTGALTGAVSAAASLATDNSGYFGHSGDKDPVGIAERTAIAAVAGGTASVLTGGKFANGAITGAFAQLYNGEGKGEVCAAAAALALGTCGVAVVADAAAGPTGGASLIVGVPATEACEALAVALGPVCGAAAAMEEDVKNSRRPGKLGGEEHRGTVYQRGTQLIDEGHEIIAGGGRMPEQAVETPEGRVRYPDIISRDSEGNLHYENVGRATQSGMPIARETRALSDVGRATGKAPTFTPYRFGR